MTGELVRQFVAAAHRLGERVREKDTMPNEGPAGAKAEPDPNDKWRAEVGRLRKQNEALLDEVRVCARSLKAHPSSQAHVLGVAERLADVAAAVEGGAT